MVYNRVAVKTAATVIAAYQVAGAPRGWNRDEWTGHHKAHEEHEDGF
jgi:hypothetical protein